MDQKTILIVEDEDSIAEVLIAYCKKEGYVAQHFHSGEGVAEYVQKTKIDLILLDLMLPEVDGISICKQVRVFSKVPIIIVSAKSEEIDRLLGLELGADDYICKPFSPREVIARIKAVLRRFEQIENKSIKASGFEIYPEQYGAYLEGEWLDFTPIEFKIIELLMKHLGRVFSRDEILNRVYDENSDISDRNIDTHIKNIRKKIAVLDAQSNPIASVYGVGYKFLVRKP